MQGQEKISDNIYENQPIVTATQSLMTVFVLPPAF